jgi:arylsulfatase A-like enzyme
MSAQGVTFDQHISQAPWTKPGMGALYTGRFPRELHLDNPGRADGYREVVREDVTLLAEHMKAAGDATIGAVANPNLKSRFGYAQGFDHYSEPDRGYRQDPNIPSGGEIVDDVLASLDRVPADQPGPTTRPCAASIGRWPGWFGPCGGATPT